MKHELIGKPDFPVVKITLNDGECIVAEAGAMVSMTSNIAIETSARGGVMGSLKRMVFSGESFFQNKFTANGGSGEIIFAPETMGDLHFRELKNEALILSRGAYVCGSPDLKIESKWGGFKSLFGGEGLMFQKIEGTGSLFFSSFGAIEEIVINGEYVIDNGHIVGFEPSLDFSIEKVGGLKSLFLSGEGFVCRFKGHGKAYIQTRNHSSFAVWADGWRKVESRQ
ncbi:MAG: TIGR00266 family protein [Spirochaetia bacterium]|nr:TIGR00266 family protein [Spirochaetia bacterium]